MQLLTDEYVGVLEKNQSQAEEIATAEQEEARLQQQLAQAQEAQRRALELVSVERVVCAALLSEVQSHDADVVPLISRQACEVSEMQSGLAAITRQSTEVRLAGILQPKPPQPQGPVPHAIM